jgi:hypothetical protein
MKSNGILSEKIEGKRGIKQGNFLSPLLFHVAVNEIIEYVIHKKGCKIGDKALNIICYA